MIFKKTKLTISYCLIGISMLLSAYTYSCTGKKEPGAGSKVARIMQGKQLAQKYCSSCHMEVSPERLPRKIWTQQVLPAMATKLGIDVWSDTEYYLPPGQKGKQGITLKKWRKIVAYFKEEAPDSLKAAKPPAPLQKGELLFRVRKPEVKEGQPVATTAMVTFSPDDQFIYTANAVSHQFYRWNQQLQPHYLKSFAFPPVDIQFLRGQNGSNQAVITTIGTMRAVNSHRGRVLKVALSKDSATIEKVIADNLRRPVKAVAADFNKDGLRDWVICGFGHEDGALYIAEQQQDGTYQQSIIRKVPGAIDAAVGDFNKDGWPDLMVLFAHGNEGIWLFENDKTGGFNSRPVLRFPPVYGSTSFQLVDFNGDGKIDIVYTNGDNADYSAVLKPYHGLRIFINQGGYRYEEAYFYPINGTYKALARDFDGDGDQDIATIAFFPDFQNKPDESFLYFEQTKPLQFTPRAVPVYEHGRWISMDAGDFDEDGDPDIVLGNFSRGLRKSVKQGGVEAYWDEYTPFTLLVNQIGK